MAQRLFNITRDAGVYTLNINGQNLNVDINYIINNINNDLQEEDYENATTGLKFLRHAIMLRKQLISKLKANQISGTSYSGGYIVKEYNDLLHPINSILSQIEHELLRQQREEAMRRQQLNSIIQQMANRDLYRRQVHSVMRQVDQREVEDYYDQELVNQHMSSLVRQIRTVTSSKIKIRAYIGSETMHNSAYYITNREHNDRAIFSNLEERVNLYREVPYQTLSPIFDISSEPFELTYFNNRIHHGYISITAPNDVSVVQETLSDILNTEGEFYTDNFWFRFEFPSRLTPTRISTVPVQDSRSSELRTQVQALTQREVDNYSLMSDINFPHIYFTNTPKDHDDNCLINELIQVYSFTNGHSISKKTIKEFFRKNPPSIGSLKKFCNEYNISLTLLDLVEAVMVNTTAKKSKRPAIAFIVHNEHVQRYTEDLRSKIDLSVDDNHDIEGYRDTRKSLKFKPPKELTTIGLGKGSRANFSFEYQRNVRYMSLLYEELGMRGSHEVEDMAKAFYTCIMNSNHEQAVPKFQVTDQIKPYTGGKIKPIHEYYLKDISTKIANNKGRSALGGQTNNIMMGFRLAYEINMGRLTKEDIGYVRVATDHGTVGRLQKLLEGQDPDNFKYLNGLFGQAASGVKTVTFNVNFNDLRLLLVNSPDLVYEDLGNGQFKITKTFSHGKYRYLNNFDYYNYTIELCNYTLTKKVDEVMAANLIRLPDLRITKLWVDCVGFNHPSGSGVLCTAPLHSDNIKFKSQPSNFCGNVITFKYHDPEVLIEKSRQELQSFIDDNMFLGGGAGCGKTYYALRNLQHDFRVTFKNKNAIRIKGKTIHTAFLLANMGEFYKHCSRSFRDKTVLVDEVSDVSSFMWSVFFTCHKLYNTKFLFIGDFKQVPPYGEKPDRTDYLWSNMDRKTVYPPPLPEGVRPRCDPDLMELALALRENPYHPIPEHLFHTQFHSSLNSHFSFTKNCRTEGNMKTLEAREQTFFPATRGLRVIATVNNKNSRYVSGEVFTVLDFWDPRVTLKSEDDTDKTIVITPAKYLKNFMPAYFQTIHSSQGATIEEDMCIYEIDKIRRSPDGGALLYMALTRPRHMSQLRLYHTYPLNFIVDRTMYENMEPKSYIKLNPDRVNVVPKVTCALSIPKEIVQIASKIIHKVPDLSQCLRF